MTRCHVQQGCWLPPSAAYGLYIIVWFRALTWDTYLVEGNAIVPGCTTLLRTPSLQVELVGGSPNVTMFHIRKGCSWLPLATYLLIKMALIPLFINYTFVSHGSVMDFGDPGVPGCFNLSFATLERCTRF